MANWALVYAQGRCKAIGVPWSEEEAHAALVLKIPAEYVRQGVLTWEDYEKAKSKNAESIERTKKIPLIQLRRNQLVALCANKGINVSEEVTRPVMIEMLLDAGSPKSVSIEEVPEGQEESN